MMPHDAVVKEAMCEAFLACDADFIANHGSAGSTATTVLMLGQRAYCCNVGDSRTVLSRAGRALALSSDHKPSREDEAARIKAAGGFIINKRVMGELASVQAVQASAGFAHSGVVTSDGELYCWGMNDDGCCAAHPKVRFLAEPTLAACIYSRPGNLALGRPARQSSTI